MLSESRLNIYIAASDLKPRQRERIGAQVESALRSIPAWMLALLRRRLDEMQVSNALMIVEPQSDPGHNAFDGGRIGDRPAFRLAPRIAGDTVDWGQDLRFLLAKGIAYLAAPSRKSEDFWAGWSASVQADGLEVIAATVDAAWSDAADLDYLVEMCAALALNSKHARWAELPHVMAFLNDWCESGGGSADAE